MVVVLVVLMVDVAVLGEGVVVEVEMVVQVVLDAAVFLGPASRKTPRGVEARAVE